MSAKEVTKEQELALAVRYLSGNPHFLVVLDELRAMARDSAKLAYEPNVIACHGQTAFWRGYEHALDSILERFESNAEH